MARVPDARLRRQARPLFYYITDRHTVPGGDPLPVIEQAIRAGIGLIQVRERDLATRSLLALVEAAIERARSSPRGLAPRGTASRVLVNDRLDVALAAGAAGVHLPTHGFPVVEVRRRYPALLLGASCHNLNELHRAEEGGADFAVFGPIYEPASKKTYGPPLGLEKLAEAVRAVAIPVLALGGINLSNAAACLEAGAAGLAAVSLFQKSSGLKQTVACLRELSPEPSDV